MRLSRTIGRASRRRLFLGRGGDAVALVGAIVVVVIVAVVASACCTPRIVRRARPASGPTRVYRDRTGRILVASRAVISVKVDPSGLPHGSAARTAELRRLALAMSSANLAPGTPFSMRVASRLATFNRVHRGQFPGVTVERGWVRNYPFNDLAAALLGTVGPVNQTELRNIGFAGTPGATVGQSGLEAYYNSALRSGETLKLSLDVPLQIVGQQALQRSIDSNHPATGGAFVAWTRRTARSTRWARCRPTTPTCSTSPYPLDLQHAVRPQLRRPAGQPRNSERKPDRLHVTPITAPAALESGAWSVGDIFDDTGQFCFSGQCRHNSGRAVDGVLDLADALQISSNDFFFYLGALTGSGPRPAGALDAVGARVRYRPADRSGPARGERGHAPRRRRGARAALPARSRVRRSHGAVRGPAHTPPRGLRDRRRYQPPVVDRRQREPRRGPRRRAGHTATTRRRLRGDRQRRQDRHPSPRTRDRAAQRGRAEADRPSYRHTTHSFDPLYLKRSQNLGLASAASQPGRHLGRRVRKLPRSRSTAPPAAPRSRGHQDDAWYAGYVPASATAKPVVVVVTVQRGGFGAHTAAPVARQILSQRFLGRPGAWVAGRSKTL